MIIILSIFVYVDMCNLLIVTFTYYLCLVMRLTKPTFGVSNLIDIDERDVAGRVFNNLQFKDSGDDIVGNFCVNELLCLPQNFG